MLLQYDILAHKEVLYLESVCEKFEITYESRTTTNQNTPDSFQEQMNCQTDITGRGITIN